MANFKDYEILANIYILCLDQNKEIKDMQGELSLNFLQGIDKNEKCKICNDDWYFLSNFNANWYELDLGRQQAKNWLFKMRDDSENYSEMTNDAENNLFYDGKCYYQIIVNEIYKDELYNLLQNIQSCSETNSIIVLFYIEQGAHGERVQGVLKLKEFIGALCNGSLRFDTAYLVR